MGGRFDGGFFPGPGLELVLVALVLFAGPVLAVAEPIDVRITPVPLSADDPGLETAGRLKYRGGIHLVADDPTFGGLSALGVSDDGKRMVALSDRGRRFSARLVYDETGNLAGLRNTDLATMAGLDGAPLSSRDDGDAESMSPGIEGEIIVAFERRHRLWRYLPGVTVPEPLPGPDEMQDLPFNNGIEALTLLADGSLLALSEGKQGRKQTVGWISSRDGWSVLTFPTPDGFRVTGAATMTGGDVLVLERFFTLRGSNRVRLKRISAATIKPGGVLAGTVIARLRPPLTVDNFEGIDVRKGPAGEIFIYLVSDDNFNPEQRTLLMMFELME